MYLFHSFARILHSDESFLVDVRGFNRIYLLLKHRYLPVRLFKGVLVLLLALKGVAGSYAIPVSASTINNTPRSSLCLLHPCMLGGRRPTSLIRTNILPRNLILLRHLILQMPFPLLQHIELLPQINDSFLRCIFPLLRRLASKPGSPHLRGRVPFVPLISLR